MKPLHKFQLGFVLLAAFAAASFAAPRWAAGEVRHDTSAASAASPERCTTWEARYVTMGSLRITDTPMGAGDGDFSVGPGSLVVRVDARSGRAELKSFELRERFVLRPSAVVWSATLVTDVWSHLAAGPAEAAPRGQLGVDGVLRWASPLRSYRSDGSLLCDGSLCGKFGAPARGRTELHMAPAKVQFEPLRFDPQGATFQMDQALVSESHSPEQKTYLALAGRRVERTCIQEIMSDDGAPGATSH